MLAESCFESTKKVTPPSPPHPRLNPRCSGANNAGGEGGGSSEPRPSRHFLRLFSPPLPLPITPAVVQTMLAERVVAAVGPMTSSQAHVLSAIHTQVQGGGSSGADDLLSSQAHVRSAIHTQVQGTMLAERVVAAEGLMTSSPPRHTCALRHPHASAGHNAGGEGGGSRGADDLLSSQAHVCSPPSTRKCRCELQLRVCVHLRLSLFPVYVVIFSISRLSSPPPPFPHSPTPHQVPVLSYSAADPSLSASSYPPVTRALVMSLPFIFFLPFPLSHPAKPSLPPSPPPLPLPHQVPMVSYSATDPSLSAASYPFFTRTIRSDALEMQAIAGE
ncbi:unnamed protein product [Closterium sp. NIES-53]